MWERSDGLLLSSTSFNLQVIDASICILTSACCAPYGLFKYKIINDAAIQINAVAVNTHIAANNQTPLPNSNHSNILFMIFIFASLILKTIILIQLPHAQAMKAHSINMVLLQVRKIFFTLIAPDNNTNNVKPQFRCAPLRFNAAALRLHVSLCSPLRGTAVNMHFVAMAFCE